MTACLTNSCTSIFSGPSGVEKAVAGRAATSNSNSSANRRENLTDINFTPSSPITPSGNRRIPLFCRWRLLLGGRMRVAQHLAQTLIAERRRNERKHEHQQREKCQHTALGVKRRKQRHIGVPAAGKAQHHG